MENKGQRLKLIEELSSFVILSDLNPILLLLAVSTLYLVVRLVEVEASWPNTAISLFRTARRTLNMLKLVLKGSLTASASISAATAELARHARAKVVKSFIILEMFCQKIKLKYCFFMVNLNQKTCIFEIFL